MLAEVEGQIFMDNSEINKNIKNMHSQFTMRNMSIKHTINKHETTEMDKGQPNVKSNYRYRYYHIGSSNFNF